MVLFQVSTHFQLICAINVKIQFLRDVDADLHLDDTTNFNSIIENLKESGIFRYIEYSDQIKKSIRIKEYMNQHSRKIMAHIEDIWGFQYETAYTDIYFGHDMIPNKWYYYYLVEQGMAPKVHILDEGMACYYKDLLYSTRFDFIDHKKYKKKEYLRNIGEQLLYNPQAYMYKGATWPVKQIPQLTEEVKQVLSKIYSVSSSQFPAEKYVYLAAGGYEENYFHNELELVHQIAEQVGKDNIIIKQHPRNNLDIYSHFGYKVWTDTSGVPFEILLMEHDTTNQVLMTLFSNAALSPKHLFGREQKVLFLYHLFVGSGRHGLFGKDDKASFQYLNKLKEALNANKKLIYTPKTQEELREVIWYLNGSFKCGGQI